MWTIELSKAAMKDAAKIQNSPHASKVNTLIALLAINPFQNPPPYKRLEPPTADMYSRRINDQHRLTYTVHKDLNVVKIRRMWTHYE